MGANHLTVSAPVAVLCVVSLQVMAQEEHTGPEGGHAVFSNNNSSGIDSQHGEPSYFRYDQHTGWIMAHIGLIIFAWVIVMPVAVMLSVARSRLDLPTQCLFHIINSLAILTGVTYNHATPDLYKNNAHTPIGWIVTSFAVLWTVSSWYMRISSARQTPATKYQRLQRPYSDRSQPPSTSGSDDEEDLTSDEVKTLKLSKPLRVARLIMYCVEHIPYAHVTLRLTRNILDMVLLLLGFLALASGFVIYGGVAHDRHVYSFLAHWIKGAIFFWYGLLTLARWLGAFTEFGWAWNVKPSYPMVKRWKARVPSAEFTESYVIWLYGVTNVSLEHVNHWGEAWTTADLEHVSITILFFGGGLLGMVIESLDLFRPLDISILRQKIRETEPESFSHGSAEELVEPSIQQQTNTHVIPTNPMPGLVIMVLGLIMSAHRQSSMVSTMMHTQWGTLLMVFSIARAVTYIVLYLKPPTTHFPSRPPSELVAAYCLSLGGLMFMVSANDTVSAIEASGLDAMVVFTLAAGLTGIVLAWEVICFAIKGWATKREITPL